MFVIPSHGHAQAAERNLAGGHSINMLSGDRQELMLNLLSALTDLEDDNERKQGVWNRYTSRKTEFPTWLFMQTKAFEDKATKTYKAWVRTEHRARRSRRLRTLADIADEGLEVFHSFAR